MPSSKEEINRRTKLAFSSIQRAFGTEEDEYGATLFVSHHLKFKGSVTIDNYLHLKTNLNELKGQVLQITFLPPLSNL